MKREIKFRAWDKEQEAMRALCEHKSQPYVEKRMSRSNGESLRVICIDCGKIIREVPITE